MNAFSTGTGAFTTIKSESGLLEDYANLMQQKGSHWSDAYQQAKGMPIEELERAVKNLRHP